MLCEMARTSLQFSQTYCVPAAPACVACVAIVCWEPITNAVIRGAATEAPPSRLTRRPAGEVCSVTFTVLVALVSEKFAGLATPATVAVTVYGPPAVPFAVKVGAVATPEALVVALAVSREPGKVPLGPLPGAVKVTITPGTGFAKPSLTV